MRLSGLHLLLTYQCTMECDHCFVWGSPWQTGTLTLGNLRLILEQAREIPTIRSIYFEGGEPALYYSTLLAGVKEAAQAGFEVSLVTNAYWAVSEQDAVEWLRPFTGLIQDLSISSDLYHYQEEISQQIKNACAAADYLGLNIGVISIAQPQASNAEPAFGQLPESESAVMFRGRAAAQLVKQASLHPWEQFTACTNEDLVEPGRVHVDPFGYVHICQGISLGNLFQTSLSRISEQYNAANHPITGPLLAWGPVGLVREYQLPHQEAYADACHLCDEARRALRSQFPEILTPDQMYGLVNP